MAQLIDLGKLRFNFRGDYNSATEYSYNDVVSSGGSAYVYKSSTATTGNQPPNATYWAVLSSGVQYEGEWSGSTSYQANDIVTYGPKSYIAKVATTGDNPATSPTDWEILVDGIGHRGDWAGTTDYFPGDIVTRGASQYICLLAHTSYSVFQDDLDAGKWTGFVHGLRFLGNWTSSTAYLRDDVVTDGLDVYVANEDFTSNATAFENEPVGNWTLLLPGTDAFPAQLGKANHLLTTDGTTPSWTLDIDINKVNAVEANVGEGAETFGSALTNAVATFAHDPASAENSIAQIAVHNTDSTSQTQFAAYSDDGSQTSGFTSIGATGSTYADATTPVMSADNGYVFYKAPAGTAGTGDLVISTGETGTQNRVIIAAEGIDSGKKQVTVIPDTTVKIEIDGVNSTSPTTGALQVVGGIGATGNMQLAGDLTVNGTINVTGGAFSTESLVSSTPIFTTGSGATNNGPDRGFIVEYKKPTDSTSFELGTVEGDGTEATITRKSYTSLTKFLQNNVATIGLQQESHTMVVGDVVVVSNLGAPFDGTFAITAIGATTISYSCVGTNTPQPIADIDGTVVPNIPTDFINGDSIVIADCDIAAFNGQKNFVNSVSGNVLTFDSNITLAQTSVASGSVTVNSKTKYSGIVRNTTDGSYHIIDHIPTVLVSGEYVAPTTDIDFTDVNLVYPTLHLGGLEFEGSPSVSGNITFPGNVTLSGTANVLSGTFGGDASFTGSPTFSGTTTFSGSTVFTGAVRMQEMVEDVIDSAISANVLTCNYQSGNVFWTSTTPTANFAVDVTNAPTDNGRTFTIAVIVTQGATGYFPNSMRVGGVQLTGGLNNLGIRWANNVNPVPTGGAGRIDVFNFTFVRRGNAWTVLGNSNLGFSA